MCGKHNHCFPHSSDVEKKMAQAAGQQGPQAPPLGVLGGCAPGSGYVSPVTGRTRARLPAPSRPAWILPALRPLTATTDSRPWHRSLLQAPRSCACWCQPQWQDTALLFAILHATRSIGLYMVMHIGLSAAAKGGVLLDDACACGLCMDCAGVAQG